MEIVSQLRIKSRFIGLALAFIVLNIVDGILTQALASRGGYELNPIMRQVLELRIVSLFWIVKLGATVGAVLGLFWLANRYPRQLDRILLILIGVMTGVCVFNGIGLGI